jgi:mono/diheme cytochrome c family protein
VIGLLIAVVGAVLVVGPWAVGHRQDVVLERAYGDFAVSLASQAGGGAQNPLAGSTRGQGAGRNAFIGSCATCHGAAGDGRGAFGQGTYPPATDLRAHDTQEKSDGQVFWIIKNGLSFTGMPAFGGQYSDQDIWSMVSYIRSLGTGQAAALNLPPTPTGDQVALAEPLSDNPVARGIAVYYAQGCVSCHGPVGDAAGDLGIRRGERDLADAVRQGRAGMPKYSTDQVSASDLNDLQAFINSPGFTGRQQAPRAPGGAAPGNQRSGG